MTYQDFQRQAKRYGAVRPERKDTAHAVVLPNGATVVASEVWGDTTVYGGRGWGMRVYPSLHAALVECSRMGAVK